MTNIEFYNAEQTTILKAGREQWESLKTGNTFIEGWMGKIAPALKIGQDHCIIASCADPTRTKDFGKGYNIFMNKWLAAQGYCYTGNDGKKRGITPSERSAALECYRNKDAIIAWYTTEYAPDSRRKNQHPTKVLAEWKRATGQAEKKGKPETQLHTIEEELAARDHMPGNSWKMPCRVIVGMECGDMVLEPPDDATPLERTLIEAINERMTSPEVAKTAHGRGEAMEF